MLAAELSLYKKLGQGSRSASSLEKERILSPHDTAMHTAPVVWLGMGCTALRKRWWCFGLGVNMCEFVLPVLGRSAKWWKKKKVKGGGGDGCSEISSSFFL